MQLQERRTEACHQFQGLAPSGLKMGNSRSEWVGLALLAVVVFCSFWGWHDDQKGAPQTRQLNGEINPKPLVPRCLLQQISIFSKTNPFWENQISRKRAQDSKVPHLDLVESNSKSYVRASQTFGRSVFPLGKAWGKKVGNKLPGRERRSNPRRSSPVSIRFETSK